MSQIIRQGTPDWTEWENICEYTGWDKEGKLSPMKYHNQIVPFSSHLGVGPVFYNELMHRIHAVKAIRIAVVGEAGGSKTYTSIALAQMLNKKFSVDQVVFKGSDYLHLQRMIKPKQVIVFEEPTFSLSARSWYDVWQRIVTQTIESTRFLNTPIILPCVNRSLVDKVIREFYINYVIVMFDRGIGRVYRTSHSQWTNDEYRETAFNIYVYKPGYDISKCGRLTCLGCKELPICNKYIWPQYERKRAAAIEFYQQEGEKKLSAVERKSWSIIDLEKMITEEIVEQLVFSKKGKILVESMRMVFEEKLDIELSKRKATELCERLETRALGGSTTPQPQEPQTAEE